MKINNFETEKKNRKTFTEKKVRKSSNYLLNVSASDEAIPLVLSFKLSHLTDYLQIALMSFARYHNFSGNLKQSHYTSN